jgi:low temperature requirement protein LtrA
MTRFQRPRTEGEEQRATTLELFYDLVFVFAITQVSHLLLAHLTWEGAGQATVALLVTWWAWNYTTWFTNEVDPESPVVRLALIAIMLASLLMAVAIPGAFGDRALLFACSYVAIQVGRQSFLTFVSSEGGDLERTRASRILIWFVVSGVLWIAGALAGGPARTALWLAALALDYGAPLCVFWVPGLKRTTAEDWDIETAHFAERFQLFIIIALGESIVLTGATTSHLDLDTTRAAAFSAAFLGTAALWWLYFDYAAAIAARRLELSEARTVLARDAYTYLHSVMVAGVIVSAVGNEIVIAHPAEHLGGAKLVAVVAGPAIYLVAQSLFRWRMAGSPSVPRTLGACGCIAVAAVGSLVPGLVVAGLLVLVLVSVILYEQIRGARRPARGEPSPREALEATTAGR